MTKQIMVFFRNDDVNTLDDELIRLDEIVLEEGAAIDMAVEPANVNDKTIAWLNRRKHETPDLFSIIQHGYDHQDRVPGLGEFGGRTYEDQSVDISKGKWIMEQSFGDYFFPVFTCPKGGHNEATIRCLNDVGYKVFSSYHNVYAKNRLLYTVGHVLRRTHLLGKRISYHLDWIPGTHLFDISMSMSLIRRYTSFNECEFATLDYLKKRFRTIVSMGQPVIGITLHHRYHKLPESMELVRETICFLKEEGCCFGTLESIYHEYVRQ